MIRHIIITGCVILALLVAFAAIWSAFHDWYYDRPTVREEYRSGRWDQK